MAKPWMDLDRLRQEGEEANAHLQRIDAELSSFASEEPLRGAPPESGSWHEWSRRKENVAIAALYDALCWRRKAAMHTVESIKAQIRAASVMESSTS